MTPKAGDFGTPTLLSSDLHVEVEPLRDEDIAVAHVRGTLDRFSGPHLKELLVRAVESGTNQLVVDLGGVASVDSSGLGVLVGTLKLARRTGGDLRLACVGPRLTVIIERLALDQLLRRADTVQDAIALARAARSN